MGWANRMNFKGQLFGAHWQNYFASIHAQLEEGWASTPQLLFYLIVYNSTYLESVDFVTNNKRGPFCAFVGTSSERSD